MRLAHRCLIAASLALAPAPAFAETAAHIVATPQELAWRSPPPALPAGSEVAMLYGDPTQPGPFVMRLRAPKGYRVSTHTHPDVEVVTVLSGALRISMGGAEKRLPAGGFFAMPAGVEHRVEIDEDAVIQINASGPWGIDYVDPKDDPRKKTM
jgi:quercetin dioxygenase-like cupin family protein